MKQGKTTRNAKSAPFHDKTASRASYFETSSPFSRDNGGMGYSRIVFDGPHNSVVRLGSKKHSEYARSYGYLTTTCFMDGRTVINGYYFSCPHLHFFLSN